MTKSAMMIITAVLLAGAAWAQKSETPGNATPTAPAKPTVETKTYKGTLMDASCAANVTQNAPSGNAQSSAADRQSSDNANQKSAKGSGTADRSQGCSVSENTKEFALQTKDGRILHFDAVGNDKAQAAFKNRKKWSSDASAGKAIAAKVNGTLEGDNLTVLTID